MEPLLGNNNNYRRLALLEIDRVINKIGVEQRVVISNVLVRVSSPRLKTFKDSVVCAGCGISGAFFAIEQAINDGGQGPHLNMYAVLENGKEVLMTADHIIALADGGKDSLDNLQTMCYPCNHKKASLASKKMCGECGSAPGSHKKSCSKFAWETYNRHVIIQRAMNAARPRCELCGSAAPNHKWSCSLMKAKRAVCLLVKREDGKFLAVSRPNRPTEFGLPGGKVEETEDIHDAVVREVREETGLEVKNCIGVFTTLCRGSTDYLTTAFVGSVSGEIKTEEPVVVAWVDRDVLINGPFGEYNKALFAYLDSHA